MRGGAADEAPQAHDARDSPGFRHALRGDRNFEGPWDSKHVDVAFTDTALA
jgi:hypothetical protein